MTLSDDEIFGTGLVRRAKKVGVSDFSARERAKLVANAFFANGSCGERYAIELQFYDLIHNIAELIGKQEPERTKTAIRTILSDLVFLRDGFEVGKRPRLNRVVSLDALHVLLGRLPAALIPPAWAGADFSDFGGVGMLAEHVKEEEESDEESESEKKAPVWLTSTNSLLLPAFFFLMDAKLDFIEK